MKSVKIKEFLVTPGVIEFDENKANEIIASAQEVAEYINDINLDDENIKFAKKKLADAKKLVKALNDKKLEIKKLYMQPFTFFENTVKEAKNIVDEADKTLRNQVKDIEQLEKDEKEKELKELFNEQVKTHGLEDIYTFNKWIKSEFLNKSFSIKKAMENLTLTLEKISNDLEMMKDFKNAEKIAAEYLGDSNLDISIAKKVVENRINEEKKLKEWFRSYEDNC